MDWKGITTSLAIVVVVILVVAGAGAYFLLTEMESAEEGGGENDQEYPPENQPSGGEITVQFVDSTYEVAAGGTSGWFHTGQDADIMLSSVDFNNTGGPLLFNHPMDIATDGARLLLADTRNNRVLIWNSLPVGNTPLDLVLGQENFYSNNPGTGLDELNWPASVATDGQRVAVADTNNDRILIWNSFPTENGQPADLVIEGTSWPWGVWTNGEKLAVSCTGAATVWIWNSFPVQNNQDPDIRLTGDFFGTPRSITSDGERLIIGDHNPRVDGEPLPHATTFFWNTFPTSDTQPYDFYMDDPFDPAAWMRGTFTPDGKLILFGVKLHIWDSYPAGSDDAPDLSVSDSYSFEWGDGSNVVHAGGRLYICEYNGNKIVGFSSLPTSSNAVPDFAIGAPDIHTNTLRTNYFIDNPVPISDGQSLFVSSDFEGRLYVWKNRPDESGAHPDIVYVLPEAPWDSTIFENKLILAGKRSVYIWDSLPLNGELPDRQLSDRIGSVELQELKGVALDGQYFYLADKNANKIHVWVGIPDEDTNPVVTLEIESPTRLSSDGSYLVAAATEAAFDKRVVFFRIDELSSNPAGTFLTGINVNLPQDVLAVDGHFFLADTCFNRVLIWDDISDAVNGGTPDVVLGAEDFNDTLSEIGRDKLSWPGAVSFDGNYLWVGEFKFSGRLLRFSPS